MSDAILFIVIYRSWKDMLGYDMICYERICYFFFVIYCSQKDMLCYDMICYEGYATLFFCNLPFSERYVMLWYDMLWKICYFVFCNLPFSERYVRLNGTICRTFRHSGRLLGGFLGWLLVVSWDLRQAVTAAGFREPSWSPNSTDLYFWSLFVVNIQISKT